MKLTGSAAAAFCQSPDAACLGVLLHGPDAGLLALRRQDLVRAVTEGDDLRLARVEPGELRSDPALLDTAIRSQGFFPGRRAVLVEEARDGLAKTIAAGLEMATAEDAFLIVTGSGLTAKSALRKLFDESKNLISLGFYPDAPDAAEISRALEAAGLSTGLTEGAERHLLALAAAMDPGSFHQLIEKIAVFAMGKTAPLEEEDLLVLGPAAVDAELDRLVAVVAEGRPGEVGILLRRLTGSGVSPIQMLLALGRHFRQIMALSSAPDGVEAALGRLRPPAFGDRRRSLGRQAAQWGPRATEAVRLLFETDRRLRSAGAKPDLALVERCLLRLAMMAAPRR